MNPQRILLVEDEEAVATCLVQALTMDGYSVVHAPTAEAGWRLFQTAHPRAVITDNQLLDVGMTGLDLARRIREASPATPIVMLSGIPPNGATGVCDYVLTKPFPFRKLAAILAGVGVSPPGPGCAPVPSRRGRGMRLWQGARAKGRG